jgi:putative peptide zinc metalloprotease protein
MVRFDGYHVLADVTGVPDLYSRIKPTLLGILPWRWGDPRARLLKPWARVVVTMWVMVVIPLLLSALATAIIALPRVMGTAFASLGKQRDILTDAWADGDMIQATARVLAMVAIVIPVAGVIYLLVRLARRSSLRAWRGTTGKPLMRLLAVLFGGAVLGGVAYAWFPHDSNYRPIQPWERGTIGDIVFALGVEPMGSPPQRAASPRLAASSLVKGQRGVIRTLWDTQTPLPTKRSPQLAVNLIPKPVSGAVVGGGGGGGGFASAPTTSAEEGWVFPVNKPLAPEPGDNQALAVNTTDDTVVYEAAFAMVWAEDDSDAMNVNEAQAYASCDSCAAVAVAFQVVFVVDNDETDDNVVAPQNLAGALNYDCANCMTYALARQLFITLDEPLSDDAKARLDDLWAEIAAYGKAIEAGQVPSDEIDSKLDAYEEQIKAIVEADQPGSIPSTTAPPSSSQSTSVAVTQVSGTPPIPPPPPPSSATSAPTSSSEPTVSSQPTASSEPTSVAPASDPSSTSDPTAPTDSAPSDGAPSDVSPADGSTSDGSTSGGTATSP